MMRFYWVSIVSGKDLIVVVYRLIHSVITKLPFPNPVSTAQQIIQLEMKEQERSYFGHYAMKMMLLQLYQGLGRFSRPHQKSAEIWLLDVRATISKYAMKVKVFSRKTLRL